MKRLLIPFAAALAVISGCHPDEKGFDGTSLKGNIQSPGITWSAGDSIGVSGTVTGNNRFVLNAGSAGLAEGIFTGNMTGEPLAAYYPYRPEAGATAIKSVSMTLPSEQAGGDNGPDMSLDVRVAGEPDGSVSKGFTFNFVRKLAIVRINLIPDAEMDGKLLQGVSLGTNGLAVTGEFNMNLVDPAAALSFTKKSDKVFTTFAKPEELRQGKSIAAFFLINPGIAKNDSLFITFPLEDASVIAGITATRRYEAGMSYTLDINVAELRKEGKIRIDKGEGTVFTNIEKYGLFDLSSNTITGFLTYIEGENQYSTSTNSSYSSYSVTDIFNGKAFKTRITKKAGTVNETYDIQVVSTGCGFKDGTYKATLVKISGNMYWFVDKTAKVGFILYK